MKKATKKAVKKAVKVPAVIGELERVKTAIASIDKVGAGIKALAERYQGAVYDVRTAKGMADAKAARFEIRQPRYRVEEIRKEAKKPLLDLTRRLDGEAKRIESELLAIEAPIDAQIKAEEQRIENERQAAIQREQERIDGINRRIDELRALGAIHRQETASTLQERISAAAVLVIDESYAEFQQEAKDALGASIGLLRERHERLADLERREAEVKRAAPSTVDVPPLYTAVVPAGTVGPDTPAPLVFKTDGREVVLRTDGPSEAEIVDVLEAHYTASRQTIIGWLKASDWSKAGVVSARELESET